MKVVARLFVVLCAVSLVTGAFILVANNISDSSGPERAEGDAAQLLSAGGEERSAQPPVRPEGGEHEEGAGSAAAMSGMLITLAKLAGIISIVVLARKAITALANRPKTRQAAESAR